MCLKGAIKPMLGQSYIYNLEHGQTDMDLIQAIKAGKSEAITHLFREYGGQLLRICERYAKDQDTAKDLFQEGFLKILKVIDQYRNESKLDSWMCRVMVNHCINAIRKRKRDIEWVELDDHHQAYADDLEYVESGNLNVNQVLELMNALPYGYRLVLNMYAIDQKTHNEIASELGISISTSKSQLFKARRALLQLIKNKTQ